MRAMSLGPVQTWDGCVLRNERYSPLVAIWIRHPTDLFDRRVPIFVHSMPGSDKDLHHVAQVPDGVKLDLVPEMVRGMAICIYKDDTFRRYDGRRMPVQVPGAKLIGGKG